MNVSSVVSAVKGVAASEGGKAVAKVAKTVGNKLLSGIAIGAGTGAFIAGIQTGYKIAVKGVPAVIKPVEEILGKMAVGEPSFTVTFNEVKAPEKAVEENTEEVQNTEPTQE